MTSITQINSTTLEESTSIAAQWLKSKFPVFHVPIIFLVPYRINLPSPLQIGIYEKIVDNVAISIPSNVYPTAIRNFLKNYTKSIPYLCSITYPGSQRRDLYLDITSQISEDERIAALQALYTYYDISWDDKQDIREYIHKLVSDTIEIV
jgi:sRNA-binding protein